MSSVPIPDQQVVLNELHDLTYHLYQILDAATQRSREFFLQDHQELDPSLFPCLVRYYTKQALMQGKAGVPYVVQDLENNGLYLVHRHYHIKILKAYHGALPPAGPSRVRQWFYRQGTLWCSQELPPLRDVNASVSVPALNLVILWDCNKCSKMLQLQLACPKFGSVSQAVTHWIGAIQHPAYTLGEQSQVETFTAEMDDLDITLPPDASDDAHLA